MQVTITSTSTISAPNNTYTGYHLNVSYNVNGLVSNWTLTKRYKEFFQLNTVLTKAFPGINTQLPRFPPKVLLNMTPKVINDRQASLQIWLTAVVSMPHLLSSPHVQGFLEVAQHTAAAPPPVITTMTTTTVQQVAPPVATMSLNLGPMSLQVNGPVPDAQYQQQQHHTVSVTTTGPPATPPYYDPYAQQQQQQQLPQQPNYSSTSSNTTVNMSMNPNDAFAMNSAINQQLSQDAGNDPFAQGILAMQQGTANMIQAAMVSQGGPSMDANFQYSVTTTTSSSSTGGAYNAGVDNSSNSGNMYYQQQPAPTSFAPMPYEQYPQQPQPQPQQPMMNGAIPTQDFNQLLSSFRDQAFSDDKLSFINNFFKNHYFTSEQAVQLIEACSFSDEVVAAAIALYPRLVNQEKFYTVLDKVTFDSDKSKIKSSLGLL